MKPQNYTPHDITIRPGEGKAIVYKSVGVCWAEARERCAFTWDQETETECHGHGWATPENPNLVVMRRPQYDTISWSPREPAKGADVIVSAVTAPAVVAKRPDLRVFTPDTSPQSAIRYKSGAQKGQIKAVRRLVLWYDPSVGDARSMTEAAGAERGFEMDAITLNHLEEEFESILRTRGLHESPISETVASLGHAVLRHLSQHC